ncbi:MAG: hypothetical protein ACREJC_13000 [Tepidisphaeraceae bacterium]
MSDYNTFAAHAFGPALAEVAQEEGLTRITPALRQRAIDGWNLTPAAMQAVFAEATRLLAAATKVTRRSGQRSD